MLKLFHYSKEFICIFISLLLCMKPSLIWIINGPNLNLLGVREPTIYANISFEKYYEMLKSRYPQLSFDYFQSNIEGELVDKIQTALYCKSSLLGIILNAAAYTHTSVAIGDAIAAVNVPVVEVHISNIYAREEFRQFSYLSSKCIGSISGFGMDSYRLGVEALLGR